MLEKKISQHFKKPDLEGAAGRFGKRLEKYLSVSPITFSGFRILAVLKKEKATLEKATSGNAAARFENCLENVSVCLAYYTLWFQNPARAKENSTFDKATFGKRRSQCRKMPENVRPYSFRLLHSCSIVSRFRPCPKINSTSLTFSNTKPKSSTSGS